MKKICYITTVPITIKSFILKAADYIYQQTGWDITFICDYDQEFEKMIPEYMHYIPVSMKRGISFSGIKAMLEMRKIFKREKFDLIQYSTPNASLYASLAGWLAKVPVRLYCQWGMAFVGMSGFKRKIFKTIEKFVCSRSTWIEPDSKGNLDFSHSIGLYSSKKSSVIWNGSASGVDLEKFDISKKDNYRKTIREKYNIPADAKVYGFVGRITRDKGINELLTAYKQIENDDKFLMLVGREEIDQNIDMQLYEWSKNHPRIIYTGSTNVVEQFLSAMDTYILPSYREGFGSGVIEAEAMGLPVIVTDIPGPTNAMKKDETGLVVKKADVETLKNAMFDIFADNEKYISMSKNAYLYAKDNFEQNQLFSYILADRKRLLGEEF